MGTNLPNPGPCPFAGFQTEGAPIGNDGVDANGVEWYTVAPPHAKLGNQCGIVYFSDGKEIWHNSRVFADEFANAGYHVVVVKHRGVARAEGLPYTPETREQQNTRPDSQAVDNMIQQATTWLKSHECDRIGAVGYCAGGSPILTRATDTTFFTAAFVAHPTGTSQAMFGAVAIPVSVAFADNDTRIDRAQRTAAETGLFASGVPYQISLYSHVHHGFSCRRAFTT